MVQRGKIFCSDPLRLQRHLLVDHHLMVMIIGSVINGNYEMNDYYYDNSPAPVVPSSASFTVSYNKLKAVLLVVVILLPLTPIVFFRGLMGDVYASGQKNFVTMSVFMLVLMTLMFLTIFLNSVGKRVIVQGSAITIRRWFIFSETITISQVIKCDVITNLVVHTKYGSRRYNKLILYYGGNNLSMTDDVYDNWQLLVDYMTYNRKNENIDGTSKAMRFFEGLFKK